MVRSSGSLGLAALLSVSLLGVTVSLEGEQARKGPAKKAAKAAAKATVPPLAIDIRVVGVQVVGESVGPSEYGEVTAFSNNPGVQVALGVKVPAAYTIIDSDEDESTVDRFVDDQGTDLAIEADYDFSPTITKDQTGLVTTLRSQGKPAPTAREFTVEGKLSVTTAYGESAARAAKVAIVKGTAFKAGGTAYTVEDVEPSDEETYVSLAMTREAVDRIKEVRFFDAAGAPIEGSLSMRGYSMDTGQVSYRVKGSPKVATIEVVRHEGLQKQQVPFTFTLGLGSVR